MNTQHPLITVHIPDYDKTFVYALKLGDLAAFDDNNKLELADRAQLTDMVSIINAKLMRLNELEHKEASAPGLLAALEQALRCVEYTHEREGCPQTLRAVKSAIAKAKGQA